MKKDDSRSFEISFYEGIIKEKPDYVNALVALAEAYTAEGHYTEGLEIDKRLARLCPKDPIVRYNLACSYALTEQREKALEALVQAVKLGYRDFNYLRKDPDLKSLHQDPKFTALMEEGKKTRKAK
jgi:tetratricopeptide (TPR) repeat protein